MVLCLQNSDFKTRLTSLYGFQSSSVVLSTHTSVLSTRIKRLYGFQPSPVGFCMQNSDFWTRITSLCGSQTSPVIFCMQNSVPIIRNTSLHGSQPSRVVFRCKTATYWPEKQVSMGPRLDLSFCTCTTMRLAPELLGSMGLSPHLWVLHAKQQLLDQCTSLYGWQTSPVILSMQICVISSWNISINGSQT